MIEFGLKKRATNGKKSRFLKKFPRKRILHRGDEKAASWFRNNWIDDNYTYLNGNEERSYTSSISIIVHSVYGYTDRLS